MAKKKQKISRVQKSKEPPASKEPMNGAISEFSGKSFFDKVPDLICIASVDGYFKRLSPYWEKTFGFTREELLASSFMVFVHPDDIEQTVDGLEQLITRHEIVNFINRYRCKDGSYRWLQWQGSVINDGNEILAVARDITELQTRLLETDSEREQYKGLFENAPLGYMSLDPEGNIIHINNPLTELLGYTEQEISGKWFGELAEPGKEDDFRHALAVLTATGSIHAEIPVTRKDGTQLILRLEGVFDKHPDEEGYSHCLVEDITEDRKITQSIEENERKLTAVFESLDDAILVLDKEGRTVFSNSKFTGMWGIPIEKLGLGEEENLMNFVVNRLKELKKIQSKARELGDGLKIQTDLLEFSDGRIFEIRSHPWVMDNQVQGRVLFLRDNTDKIRNEKEKAESEQRFRFIAEYSPDLIFIRINGKISYVNRQCESVTGYSQEAFYSQGLDFFSLIDPEYQRALMEKLRLLSAGQPADPFECSVVHRNGNIVQTLLSITQIKFNGDLAIIGVVTDITEYKQAERITRQKVESLERYHDLMVGREMKMIELKREINKLLLLLGEEEKYKIVG
jgi:PAS domain S-box-containing protein